MLFYEELLSTTDILMLSKGYPKNWNSSNVQVIGLASTANNLNRTKVGQFLKLNYEKVKKKISIENREFFFKLENKTNTIGTLGNETYNNSENINTITREGLMENEKIKMTLTVWDQNE